VQELRVYRTADGAFLGRTPTFPRSPNPLPGEFQSGTVKLAGDGIAADVKFYVAGDSHASGPSLQRRVHWSWNGHAFDQAPVTLPPEIDLGHATVTLDGIGPLRFGMSWVEAVRALRAEIKLKPGPVCDNGTVDKAPGLLLQFLDKQDRLAAIVVGYKAVQGVPVPVRSPRSIATASGIHIGSTIAEVMRAYPGQVAPDDPNKPDPDLVFTPRTARYASRLMVFGMENGRVSNYVVGEKAVFRAWQCQ
jgi:hypothetical protein